MRSSALRRPAALTFVWWRRGPDEAWLDRLVHDQHHDRTADRRQEARVIAALVPAQALPEERREDRTPDAEERGHDPAHGLSARHDPACEHTDKETDQDGCEHSTSSSTHKVRMKCSARKVQPPIRRLRCFGVRTLRATRPPAPQGAHLPREA